MRLGEAWVGERALSTPRLVWLPAERRVGGYRLHFTLTEGIEVMRANNLMFLRDDVTGHSVGGNSSSDGKSVCIDRLDSPDVSALRLSVVRSFDAPRHKNIRFLPKRAP